MTVHTPRLEPSARADAADEVRAIKLRLGRLVMDVQEVGENLRRVERILSRVDQNERKERPCAS